MFSLALKWGTDVASIRAANGMDPRDNDLGIGQRLAIPANSKRVSASALRHVDGAADWREAEAKPQTGKGKMVVVAKGDTLYGIARAHKVSVSDLRKANNLGGSSNLRVGRKLLIP
jgi:LysM repeat protein